MLLKEYLDALIASKPTWNVTVLVHGIEVIRCNISDLNFDIIASNLLYSNVGLVSYDYPSQRYFYHVN